MTENVGAKQAGKQNGRQSTTALTADAEMGSGILASQRKAPQAHS